VRIRAMAMGGIKVDCNHHEKSEKKTYFCWKVFIGPHLFVVLEKSILGNFLESSIFSHLICLGF
jgi:hypothetical protein